jgi:peptide/nickel transport system substrate-binding protein
MRTSVLGVFMLVGCVALFAMGACTPDDSRAVDGAETPQASPAADANNPDRLRFVELRARPFEPRWVGGTLVIGRTRVPQTLNNLLWSSEEDRAYHKFFLVPFLLQETADRVNGALGVEPCAAAALPERSSDGKSWLFTLKPDLHWDDGSPLTTLDYVKSFEAIRNPEVRADARRAQLDGVKEVRARSPTVLEVQFNEDSELAPLHFGLQFTVMPAKAIPSDAPSLNGLRQHASMGPYRVAAWSQEQLVFELRPEYRRRAHAIGPHYLERVEFRYLPEEARRVALQKGEIDIDTVRAEHFENLAADPNLAEHHWLTWYFLPNQAMVLWNLRDPGARHEPHPLLGQLAIRRALSKLFAREHLVRKVCAGRGRSVSGPMWVSDSDYDASVPVVPFDPPQAKKELLAAGCREGEDGWLQFQGRRASINLIYPQGATWAEAPALDFAEAAKGIGFEVVLRKVPFGNLVEEVQSKRHEAALFLNSLRPPVEYDFSGDFHSRHLNTPAANLCGLADEVVDRLLDQARMAPTRAERGLARRSLHRRLAELEPCAFLYSSASCVAVPRRFANAKVHDLGLWYRDLVLRSLFEAAPPR